MVWSLKARNIILKDFYVLNSIRKHVINGYQKIRSRSWYCEKEGEFALEGEIWH